MFVVVLLVYLKETARHTLLKTLEQLNAESDTLLERVSVRINSIVSGLAEEDLKVILSGPVVPKTILLPKVENKGTIDQVSKSNLLKLKINIFFKKC